jgi:hypothetical protein
LAAVLGPPFSGTTLCFFTAPFVEAGLLRFLAAVEGASMESGMPCFVMRLEGPLLAPFPIEPSWRLVRAILGLCDK